MSIPNVLGQTPGFNGYGVTLDDKPQMRTMEKRGVSKPSGLMNAFSKVMEFGAPEAFEAGRQKKYRRNLSNAFKSGDMGAASNALFDMGEYDAGMGLRESVQAQQGAQQSEQARMAYEMTKGLMNEPDVMRRVQLAQQMSQQLGLPAPTDPSEFTNEAITQNLEMMRIKGGFESEEAKQPTYGNSLTQALDENGEPVFIRPDSQGGVSAVDGYSPMPRSQEQNSDRVQSTFTDANGRLMMVMRDGTIRESGHGVQNPYQITDVGGVPTAINRRTGEGISIATPEQVGGNAATIETIKTNEEFRSDAQRALPQTIENANRSLSAIDGLLNSPGFESRYGMSSVVPAIPGTEMANTQAFIDQIGGQAFLEAFESLKGGGQITEIEGQKATAAITRLGTQGIQPQAARQAAQELRDIVSRGVERAKAEASGSYAAQGADAPPLVYNPETGDFE